MAYKSQVTNKYMGSSFAGRVNPGRENELTQLAKSLNTLSDAAPAAIGAYKDEQVKKAEEQLEYLKSTMSPEELNAYILKGEDPILSNKWATSVVDGNVGRFQAGEVIKNIRQLNTIAPSWFITNGKKVLINTGFRLFKIVSKYQLT